ncbi:MAG TPA: acetate kinase [Chloroflexi bacterium]|nr:MAG: acetate kinase [Anaerolineaceae bacterium 4572_5.2]HEY86297.1 acetate kinase [Chloroflexota bacterium]
MKILVINSGSSSIKYRLFDIEEKSVLAVGIVERIGLETGRIKHAVGQQETARELRIADHGQGLREMNALLTDAEIGVIADPAEITAVGHRVVHGGEKFSQPTRIDAEVIAVIRELIPLAPLHNPANLQGIEVAMQVFSQAAHVAVFDTAFHQTMPPASYRYAIPDNYYTEHGIRVYGFHGTSHAYVAEKAAEHLDQSLSETNVITAHLGNGASITAVKNGQSLDTSMGFSPLAGLIMGTRSGDLDPAVVFYMADKFGMSPEEINQTLNKKSGLLGICGSNDARDILERQAAGDEQAKLALEMYTWRIKKYIGAYTAALGRVDALVFTAGIGENSAYIRQQSCAGLENLGIALDANKNNAPGNSVAEIQTNDSRVKILVIPTNEELRIAVETLKVLQEKNVQQFPV